MQYIVKSSRTETPRIVNVRNTLINHQRTSQMMRSSFTAFDDGYTVLPATWTKPILVYQLEEASPLPRFDRNRIRAERLTMTAF